MALFEDALYTGLSTHAGLSALVSTRVYPLVLPQDPTLPAVTYEQVSNPTEQAVSDVVASHHPRYLITGWASSYEDAKAVGVQIEAAVLAFTGGSGFTVHERSLQDGQDGYDPETLLFAAEREVRILYTG